MAQQTGEETRRVPRPLVIDVQKQSARLLLAWLCFGIRVHQTFRALVRNEPPNPMPIGLTGLARIVDEALPGSEPRVVRIRGDVVAALEHVFGPVQRGEPASVRLRSVATQRVAWFAAVMIAGAHNGAHVNGHWVDEVLARTPFTGGDGFYFEDLMREFPTIATRGVVAPTLSTYLEGFYDDKRRRTEVRGAILDLIRDLYHRINRSKRIDDPYPYMFQRSAVWTALFGFAEPAAPHRSQVFFVVREARSPSSPDWGRGHFLVRDLLFLKVCGEHGPVDEAYYYSANDDVVYQLKEAPGHEQNNHCRLDGAKVEGAVQEHRVSALEMHKSLSLCVPRALLFGDADAIADGLLFAQRGELRTPGAWAVLAARCVEPSVDDIAIALRTFVSPPDAIGWLKQEGVIGSFRNTHRHRKALKWFLDRTHYAEQSWALKNVADDEARVATIVRDVLERQSRSKSDVALAHEVATRIVSSHRRHTARVAARSVILRADPHLSNSAADVQLRSALFSLDIGLSADKAA